MSLVIHLKPHERILIGHAVIRNGDKPAGFSIENKIPVLREKDIMKDDAASTTCRRLYFLIQLMYIDEENILNYHEAYWELVRTVVSAAASTKPFIESISGNILNRDYYHALKEAKKLIEYEDQLINSVSSH